MEGLEFEFVGVLVVIVLRLVTEVVGRVSLLLVVGRVASLLVVGVVGRVVGEDTEEPTGLLLQPAGATTLQLLYRVLGRYAPASPEMKSW